MPNRILKGSAVISLVAAILPSSAAHAQSVSKTVVAGGVLKVDHFASVNPDCSSRGLTVVRLYAPPTNGAIRTFTTSGFGYFRDPAFQHCNTRRVAGVTVEYRPRRGFTGSDSFGLDVIYPSGREHSTNYNIVVK